MTIYRIVQDGHVYRVETRKSAIGAGVFWTPVARFGKQENAIRFVEEQNGEPTSEYDGRKLLSEPN
jgi:hypothetical protein